MTDIDLDTRPGLPEDLQRLVQRYPREDWAGHANLGQTGRFWLERHDMFRQLGGELSGALSAQRDGRMELEDFRRWFVPRLNFFLGHLDGHHQVEDQHYFPVFQAADAGLVYGFDLLEADHEIIHADLLATAETANRFLRVEAGDAGSMDDALRRAADSYAEASEQLLRRLIRHLADEEDLIIPLILHRGKSDLGI